MGCKSYFGLACVDGTCPVAMQEEYEERCMPVTKKCKDCYFYKGCKDCALYGTKYCYKNQETTTTK